MDMTGEYRIPAPRQRVWEALNDPEILKAAIPGCEELNKVGDNDLEARVKAKVGPVSATFTGKVTLSDLNPPESYRISGEGKGGAAGFAKGGAEVNLTEDGSGTILRYTAKADVGGKLAQIGSRLIQGTAKKMADDFFGKFSAIVGDRFAAEQPAAPEPAPTLPPPTWAPAPAAVEAAPPTPAPQPTAVAPPPPPPTPTAPKPVAFQPERPSAPPKVAPPVPPARSKQPWWVWLGGLILLVIVLFWLFGR
jgi:carbon monoxide dehydrogenase subunit G